METFVLIHGARHGGWCWYKVIPLLEKAGCKAITPDLPGHGENKNTATTLQSYVDCVIEVLDSQPEPVILVGHSMGGMVISQATEYRPDKIRKLVYVCAFLLRDGESLPSRGGGHLNPKTDADLKELFYGDCSNEDFKWAKARLVSPPRIVATTPIHITDENYGRVPRVYIECRRDKAIAPSIQKQMYTDTPCERVFTMDTSHSPFFSAPDELAKNLLSVVDF